MILKFLASIRQWNIEADIQELSVLIIIVCPRCCIGPILKGSGVVDADCFKVSR